MLHGLSCVGAPQLAEFDQWMGTGKKFRLVEKTKQKHFFLKQWVTQECFEHRMWPCRGHAGCYAFVSTLKNRGKDGLAVKSSESVDPQARAMGGRTHSWAMGSTDYSTGWVDFFVRASKFGRSWSIQE